MTNPSNYTFDLSDRVTYGKYLLWIILYALELKYKSIPCY